MTINPTTSEGRVAMLKQGYSEKEIGELYNRLVGNTIIGIEWDGYKKYNWVGNRIDDADMKKLYQIKQKTKKPITILVREAVKEYIENNRGKLG